MIQKQHSKSKLQNFEQLEFRALLALEILAPADCFLASLTKWILSIISFYSNDWVCVSVYLLCILSMHRYSLIIPSRSSISPEHRHPFLAVPLRLPSLYPPCMAGKPNAWSTHGVDQLCLLQHQNSTWNTVDYPSRLYRRGFAPSIGAFGLCFPSHLT